MARTLPGEAKQKILEAAIPLFSNNGYTATSIRDIANAAGVNQNTIFRIFRDKYSLYLEMFALLSQRWQFQDRIAAALRAAPDDPSALVACARVFTEVLKDHPDAARLFLFVGLENLELERRVLDEAVTPLYTMVAQRIREGIARGAFREVNPMIAARSLFAIHFYHFVLSHIFRAEAVPALAVGDPIEEYCRIWLDGIRRRGC
jgi:AcrR family transcriptional regulator